MDENPTLSEAVFNALGEALGDDGMLTGFVLVASQLDADGTPRLRVTYPDTQPMHVSLGLAAYGEEWIKDDIQYSFLNLRDGGE